MWSKNLDRCPVFVPEGLDESSLAVHCQECVYKKTRPQNRLHINFHCGNTATIAVGILSRRSQILCDSTRRERFEDKDSPPDRASRSFRRRGEVGTTSRRTIVTRHAASESRTVSAVCPQNLRIASASRASVATVSEGGWSAAKTQFFTPTCTDASDK